MVTSLILTLFPDVPPTEPISPGHCPKFQGPERNPIEFYNWIPFKGYCYFFSTIRVSWPEASVNCARLGEYYCHQHTHSHTRQA